MRKAVMCMALAALLALSGLCACGDAETVTTTAAAATEEETTEEVTDTEDTADAEETGEEEELTEDMDAELTGGVTAGTAGGWTVNDDETTGYLPEGAQEAFDAALDQYTGMSFVPVACLASQVVAGTNYMVLCRGTSVTAEPETSLKVVIVYQDTEGTATVSKVSDFDLAALYEEALAAAGEISAEADDEEADSEEADNEEADGEEADSEEAAPVITGGWTLNTDCLTANLSAEAEEAMAAAIPEDSAKIYENLALLGTQVVAGVNYAVLTMTTEGETQAIEVTFVYAGVDGTYELLGSAPLDPSSFNQ